MNPFRILLLDVRRNRADALRAPRRAEMPRTLPGRLLLVLAGLALAPSMSAQGGTTFISTLDQPDYEGNLALPTYIFRAQEFTTGNNPAGYELTEVVVDLRNRCANRSICAPYFAIFSRGRDGKPGTEISELIGSALEGGQQSFIPEKTVNLAPSTTYYIYLRMYWGWINLQKTHSRLFDAGTAPGWSVSDHTRLREVGIHWAYTRGTVKLAIKGRARDESELDGGDDTEDDYQDSNDGDGSGNDGYGGGSDDGGAGTDDQGGSDADEGNSGGGKDSGGTNDDEHQPDSETGDIGPADPPAALQRSDFLRNEVTLTFNTLVDETSVPDPQDFQVMVQSPHEDIRGHASPVVGRALSAMATRALSDHIPVKRVRVSGRKLVLVLDRVIGLKETASVSYSPGTHPIRTASGNMAPAVDQSPLRPPAEPSPMPVDRGHPARRSLLRVINHSNRSGEVLFTAVEPSAARWTPVAVEMAAAQARYLAVDQLLSSTEAPAGTAAGSLRLEVSSELDIEVLSYSRVGVGAESPVHDLVAPALGGVHQIARLGSAAHLRLVNPGEQDAKAVITGVDEAGVTSPDVVAAVAAGGTLTLSAADLEAGVGVEDGALGDGTGDWRIRVASESPLLVQGIVEGDSQRVVNDSAGGEPASHLVPLFPAASDESGRRGILRLRNRSSKAGEVLIHAHDAGRSAPDPVAVELGARAVVELDSLELELGSADKGLPVGTGAGVGAWYLRLASDLDIEVRAYLDAGDGLMAPMHDLVPEANGVHRVAMFHPAGAWGRTGRLRLVNPGTLSASVEIRGVDDAGLSPGGTVHATLVAGDAIELTADQLESGTAEAIESGSLGNGRGSWRLWIQADRPIAVMSLVSDSSGVVANLSSASPTKSFEYTRNGPPPAPRPLTPTLHDSNSLTASWDDIEGVRFDLELYSNGSLQGSRSVSGWQSQAFTWNGLAPGDHQFRIRSVSEDGIAGQWSAPSEVVKVE